MKQHNHVTYPHLLTPKALKLAEGRISLGMTDADWESYFEYWDRKQKVDAVVIGVLKHFELDPF